MAHQVVTYPVILHREPAGGYSVENPDINGGTWTQGETVEESRQMAQELIGTMLAGEVNIPEATPVDQVVVATEDAKLVVSVDLADFR